MDDQVFAGWAIVELMGHRKLAGYVSEAQIAGAAMLRIDVPDIDGTGGRTYFHSVNNVGTIKCCNESEVRIAECGGAGRAFGTWLRARRVSNGITIKRLAERIETSGPYISCVERGQKLPKKNTVDAIADALGLVAEERRDALLLAGMDRARRELETFGVNDEE